MLILLCYAAVLKFLIHYAQYYAQYYAHVKDLCLNLTILLDYIHLHHKFNVTEQSYHHKIHPFT